jgi:hypothetical protein
MVVKKYMGNFLSANRTTLLMLLVAREESLKGK